MLGIMLLALSLVSPQVFAGHGGGKGGDLAGKFFYKAHMLLELEDKLGLSSEQVKTIRDLKMSVKKDYITKEAEIEILKLDIHSQLKNDKADLAAINALVDQKYEIKKAMSKTLLESYVTLKSAVTKEQWAKFKELKKEMMGKSCAGGQCPFKKGGR
jgi:Spy/CpxP family protein refolding chaperone